MARPKLTDEGTGKPISIRLTDAMMLQINTAAKRLDIPAREVMRLCLRIGVEHFKRIDYDTAKCIVDAVESQAKPEIHGLNAPKFGEISTEPPLPPRDPVIYPKPKRGSFGRQQREAAAPETGI